MQKYMRHPRGFARHHGVSDIQFSEFRPQTRAFPCDSPFELARDRKVEVMLGRLARIGARRAPKCASSQLTATLLISTLLWTSSAAHDGGDAGAARSAQQCKHTRLFRMRSRWMMGGLPAAILWGSTGWQPHTVRSFLAAVVRDLHRQLDDRGGDLRQCLNALCPEFRFGHEGLSRFGFERCRGSSGAVRTVCVLAGAALVQSPVVRA